MFNYYPSQIEECMFITPNGRRVKYISYNIY